MPRFRLRHTIGGLMFVVAVISAGLSWLSWTLRATTYPVTGTITYNGQLLGSGEVVFAPQVLGGYQAVGPIVGGRFTLSTFAPGDGAAAGSYAIAIIAPGVPAKYQSPSTSGLSADVRKGGTTMINFDMVD
jgi:hypothetical protein